MQDEQAHFSPSITGIPELSRPNAVVAGGSRRSSGSVWLSERARKNGNKDVRRRAMRRPWGKDTVKNSNMQSISSQTPEGILSSRMLDGDRERREGTEDDRLSGEWRGGVKGEPSARGAGRKRYGLLCKTAKTVCGVLYSEVVVRGKSEREEQVKRARTRTCPACHWLRD
jgi:hypothetical protein